MRLGNLSHLCTLTCAAVLAACGGGSNTSTNQAAIGYAELQAKHAALEERVSKLGRDIQAAETQRSLEYVAAFLPADSGYSTLRFDVGTLAVSFADIQPLANGSKVKLTFGNPTSARIQGLKLRLEWGGSDIKTKEHVLTEVLLPGSWVTVSIPLDGVAPTQFSGLRIRYLGHQGIFLSGRKDASEETPLK